MGASGSEIGLHAGPAGYASLAKNAFFALGWTRFEEAQGAFLQEITPDGDVSFNVAAPGSGFIDWTTPMSLTSEGNVGMGTSSPDARLHVHAGTETPWAVFGETDYAVSGAVAVYGRINNNSGGGIAVRGEHLGYSLSGKGVYGTERGEGWGVLGTSLNGTGVQGTGLSNSGMNYGVVGHTYSSEGYGVYSRGDFGGTGAKYFVQPHPVDPSKEIRFVSLEGNESGTYFRGSGRLVDGRAVIEVPEEFRLVTESEGMTVQLTAKGPDAGLWVESEDLDRIVVRGNGNVAFHYFVNGVRRGYADLKLIRKNHAYVPEVRGVPYGTQYSDGHRRILIENGTLNPDFTPNEQTATRMGWALKDHGADEFPAHEAGRSDEAMVAQKDDTPKEGAR